MRVEGDLGVVMPETVVRVEHLFDRRAAAFARKPDGALDRTRLVDNPSARKRLFVPQDTKVLGEDPLRFQFLAAWPGELIELRVDGPSLLQKGGGRSIPSFQPLGKQGRMKYREFQRSKPRRG